MVRTKNPRAEIVLLNFLQKYNAKRTEADWLSYEVQSKLLAPEGKIKFSQFNAKVETFFFAHLISHALTLINTELTETLALAENNPSPLSKSYQSR